MGGGGGNSGKVNFPGGMKAFHEDMLDDDFTSSGNYMKDLLVDYQGSASWAKTADTGYGGDNEYRYTDALRGNPFLFPYMFAYDPSQNHGVQDLDHDELTDDSVATSLLGRLLATVTDMASDISGYLNESDWKDQLQDAVEKFREYRFEDHGINHVEWNTFMDKVIELTEQTVDETHFYTKLRTIQEEEESKGYIPKSSRTRGSLAVLGMELSSTFAIQESKNVSELMERIEAKRQQVFLTFQQSFEERFINVYNQSYFNKYRTLNSIKAQGIKDMESMLQQDNADEQNLVRFSNNVYTNIYMLMRENMEAYRKALLHYTKWNFEAYQYGQNVLASVHGSASGSSEPSDMQVALQGGLAGAALGAKYGDSPQAIVGGAIVGGVAGLLLN